MNSINVGVVGVGNMGSAHAANIYKGLVPGMTLKCICDIDPGKIKKAAEFFDDSVVCFSDYDEMLESGLLDAVIIATPHFCHPKMTMDALKHGIHVLCEKPVGVDAEVVKEVNSIAAKSDKTFAIMFNQRTNPLYKRLKTIVQNGELGVIKRFVWIINNWYRTQYYYDSGDWRGTWNKEGGGVLINQCPHNLDIWQWILGMPKRIRANCEEGKYHDITVEDEVTIFAEYENGSMATFITSTGEYPGTNRLEISGSLGKAVVEDGKLTLSLLKTDERTICRESTESMPTEPYDTVVYDDEETEDGHLGILKNFANHILFGEELIAPGIEGINELMISNAAYLSSWEDRTVTLPLEPGRFTKGLLKKQEEERLILKEKSVTYEEPDLENTEYAERWKVRW